MPADILQVGNLYISKFIRADLASMFISEVSCGVEAFGHAVALAKL